MSRDSGPAGKRIRFYAFLPADQRVAQTIAGALDAASMWRNRRIKGPWPTTPERQYNTSASTIRRPFPVTVRDALEFVRAGPGMPEVTPSTIVDWECAQARQLDEEAATRLKDVRGTGKIVYRRNALRLTVTCLSASAQPLGSRRWTSAG